jgi:predicted enzyme related to lactoylglutathione lyase
MDRVVHFEIPADDLDRAKKFYGDIFGWKLDKLGPAHESPKPAASSSVRFSTSRTPVVMRACRTAKGTSSP